MTDEKMDIEDLDVDAAEAEDVKGGDKSAPATGKIQPHELNFTHLSDKGSTNLG
jgi:hypothetical protein